MKNCHEGDEYTTLVLLLQSNTCRQSQTRETDQAVVAVEMAVQNQEVGVDCIEGAREPHKDTQKTTSRTEPCPNALLVAIIC